MDAYSIPDMDVAHASRRDEDVLLVAIDVGGIDLKGIDISDSVQSETSPSLR